MPATVPNFQDHFISVARPCPRHQVESLEWDRLPAALAPPVLLRCLVQPLERGVDLGKRRRLARGVHDIPLLVRGVRPPVSRLLLSHVAGCAIVSRERVHYAGSLLEQTSLQVLLLCRGQRHAPSPLGDSRAPCESQACLARQLRCVYPLYYNNVPRRIKTA